MDFIRTEKNGKLVGVEAVFTWEEYKAALFAAMDNRGGDISKERRGLSLVCIAEIPSVEDNDRRPAGVRVCLGTEERRRE